MEVDEERIRLEKEAEELAHKNSEGEGINWLKMVQYVVSGEGIRHVSDQSFLLHKHVLFTFFLFIKIPITIKYNTINTEIQSVEYT